MTKMTYSGPEFDMPATYRICFRGYLPKSWSDCLGGMTVATHDRAGEAPLTVLSGWLPDQAALLGVLNTLYGLHFPLLSVEYQVGDQAVSTFPEVASNDRVHRMKGP